MTPAERTRAHRQRKREQEEASEPGNFTEDEAHANGLMLSVVWDTAVVPLTKGKLRALDSVQAERLGKAFTPVIRKYLPLAQEWQYEIGAAIALVSVIQECRQTAPVSDGLAA